MGSGCVSFCGSIILALWGLEESMDVCKHEVVDGNVQSKEDSWRREEIIYQGRSSSWWQQA